MKIRGLLTVGLALIVGPGIGWADSLPTQKMLSLEVALEIAQAAIAKCRADGFHVAVMVVDSGNQIKAVLVDDGTTIIGVEAARLKAKTALATRRPSGPDANTPPEVAHAPFPLPDMVNLRGGKPIKVGDTVIGAIGVSGALGVPGSPGGDKDNVCVDAALAKVADKLK